MSIATLALRCPQQEDSAAGPLVTSPKGAAGARRNPQAERA